MAITKIHPIKTTLNLSIDYICDPAKTDEEILISSYKCGYKTAALQFEKTKEVMNSQSKNLARHLIQAFIPGEVSPHLAHQIGEELCARHLQGKYEYVLTTHVDKGHIHNHIIFNNVSYVDGKAYASNKRSYHQLRNTSDELCVKNGLSIVTEITSGQSRNKLTGISYKEYQERKGGNSYKAKLQYSIDAAIKSAKDWEDFLNILQISGYEIKHGKHISFRAVGQERFTRSKIIGEDYTENQIKKRIDIKGSTMKRNHLKRFRSSIEVVDISSNGLAMESAGFARWLKLQNLKNMATSWNEITVKDIKDVDAFNKYVNQIHDELGYTQNEIRKIELEIHTLSQNIKNINTYTKYKSIYDGYKHSTDKDAYFRMYESNLTLFEAADEALGISISPTLLSSVPLQKEKIISLTNKSISLTAKLNEQKKNIYRLNQLKNNLETYFKKSQSIDNDKIH